MSDAPGTALSAPAHAAVTVLGNGLAAGCFQAAEFGGDPKDGVPTCTGALQRSPEVFMWVSMV